MQKLDEWTKRAQVLKEKVSGIIRDSRGAQNEAKLIDMIRRTGVEYQLEAEIEDALHRIYNNGDDVGAADHDHLKTDRTGSRDTTHKRLPRLNARYFISFYEESEGKTSEVAMRTLLEYAKLDFNLVQALHQREIKEISTWWKEKGLAEKLSYARNRVVECYVWVMTLAPEPCFSRCRVFGGKTLSMVSMIDDTYDAYSAYEELKQFTSAIQRWDLVAMDELPQYVRPLYHELVTYFKACEEELEKEGYQISYSRQAVRDSAQRSEWYHNDYTPGTEEYIRVALITSGYPALYLLNMVFMKGVSIESFQWWESQPRIVMAAAEICRFIDDLASNSFEQEGGHVVSGIECFVKEKGMTEKEVHDLFIHFYNNAWKDINEACLRPRPFPMSILVKALNLARVMDVWYNNPGEDAYTFSGGGTKEMISKILVEPIPV
ncbi:hypothetical protein H6P81_007101 [Aristolochia fimbriata]|uniref:Terpene synthase metal-binding domain-containing protein n=1 Tax=Aristolochia fimbriata TaxID=158543 RepID=A0AAV7F2L8_ARIFI|nr:hypothetical protein H6P81_007101 [Aristolochia fimbriata]